MKAVIIFLSFALSSNAFALDKTTEEIKALCLIAQQGHTSSISANVQIQADGSVKLITAGGKAEVSFSKSDWDGVQQVLKAHQAADNANARDCALKMMPYFKNKVTAAPSKKSTAKPAPAAAVKSKAPAEADDVHIETHGEKSPAINGDNATVNYGN